MIVGTAGHIDHGKTALVHALTGIDTDRLKEEKARGITIDLGFAYLPAPDGRVLGFVDVPGHEKFVHNMLAGAGGIDFVLLVVAADDGVMPQTREHLAIVDLLGVGRGIVALSKVDLGLARAARSGRRRHCTDARRHRPRRSRCRAGFDRQRRRHRFAPRPAVCRGASGRGQCPPRALPPRRRSLIHADRRRHRRHRHRICPERSPSAITSRSARRAWLRAFAPSTRKIARPTADRPASGARLISPVTASPRTPSIAATWCSIPNCTPRPSASMRRCACSPPGKSRSRSGCRRDCIMRPRKPALGSFCSATGRLRRAKTRGSRWCSIARSPLRSAIALCCATRRASAPSAAGGFSTCARPRASAARRSAWRSSMPMRSRIPGTRWPRYSNAPRAMST